MKACNFIEKETLAQLFSREFCEISKNVFFIEHIGETTSESKKDTSSRILLSDFVWRFEFSLRHRNTLGKYTPNDEIKIKRCTCLLPQTVMLKNPAFFKKNAKLKIPYQEFLIFLGFINTFLFFKKTIK